MSAGLVGGVVLVAIGRPIGGFASGPAGWLGSGLVALVLVILIIYAFRK